MESAVACCKFRRRFLSKILKTHKYHQTSVLFGSSCPTSETLFFCLVVVFTRWLWSVLSIWLKRRNSNMCMDATVEQLSCQQIRHCACAMSYFVSSTKYQMLDLDRYVSRVVQLHMSPLSNKQRLWIHVWDVAHCGFFSAYAIVPFSAFISSDPLLVARTKHHYTRLKQRTNALHLHILFIILDTTLQ